MKTVLNFVCFASLFQGEKAKEDRNGLMPVGLKAIAGVSPRGLNIIAGTSAELYGVEPGKYYFMQANEVLPTDKGYSKKHKGIRQFNFSKVSEVPVSGALTAGLESPAKIVVARVTPVPDAKASKADAKEQEKVEQKT